MAMNFQIKLVLLCMAFCFKTGVLGTKPSNCHIASGNNPDGKGSGTACSGTDNNFCISYKDFRSNTAKFVWKCSIENCDVVSQLGLGSCASCRGNNCNNKDFKKSWCQVYSGTSSTSVGESKECDTEMMSCLMYKAKDGLNYVRKCSDAEITDCSKLGDSGTDCTQCFENNCNSAAFTSWCFDYSGPSAVDKGEPKKCSPGVTTCLRYKETNSGKVIYKRACSDQTVRDCRNQANCTSCNTDNCNKDPFASVCHKYSGTSTTDLGAPEPCKSGTCLSYKDGVNYVRACQNPGDDTNNKNPCTTDNCNKFPFNTGSTFSLDVRMAAIALAGSLMILRSL